MRESILRGSNAAAHLHKELGLKEKTLRTGGPIDIYEVAAASGVPVMFRALDGLLGLFISSSTDLPLSPGILITTQRPSSVQRFTCAHELGHFQLRHAASFDREESIGFAYEGVSNAAAMEIEADSFAFSFLMPSWLILNRLGTLAAQDLRLPSPIAAYQLSLRLGCSYAATVATLAEYRLIDRSTRANLKSVTPRDIKQSILGDRTLESWFPDVWILSPSDRDQQLVASESDVFLLKLPESSSAGYLINHEDLPNHGFELMSEVIRRPLAASLQGLRREALDANASVGGFVETEVVAKSTQLGRRELRIAEHRPWESPDDAYPVLSLTLDVRGKQEGLSHPEKRKALQRVA